MMQNKPNILYILADDMGYGDVSCLNEKAAFTTPYFDRMAREGIAFTDAHASSAVCTPSRYSILTGRYNWRSRLKRGVLMGEDAPLLEPGRMTLASLLHSQGYYTACIGKWHLGLGFARQEDGTIDFTAPLTDTPIHHGFDSFYGIAASLDMAPYVYIQDDRFTEEPTGWYPGVEALPGDAPTLTYARPGPCAPHFVHEEVLPQLTDRVLSTIEAHRQDPFFIYFPLPAPHTPILPTLEYRGKSGTNAYGDFCLMCDGMVGRVLDKLDELGLSENTWVIYASDNGCSPHADFPALAACGHNPSYIFRGMKSDIFEGGHRVPLLMRWPKQIPAGTVCGELTCLADMMATVADFLGIALPEDAGEDSFTQRPALEGKDTPLRESLVHQSIDGSLSIRRGRYKLEMCPGSGGWSYPRADRGQITPEMPPVQLYDLETDIGETRNIAGEHPEVVAALKKELIAIVRKGRSTPGAPQKNNGDAAWQTVAWLEEDTVSS